MTKNTTGTSVNAVTCQSDVVIASKTSDEKSRAQPREIMIVRSRIGESAPREARA